MNALGSPRIEFIRLREALVKLARFMVALLNEDRSGDFLGEDAGALRVEEGSVDWSSFEKRTLLLGPSDDVLISELLLIRLLLVNAATTSSFRFVWIPAINKSTPTSVSSVPASLACRRYFS